MERFLDALSEALWARPWSTNHPAFRDTCKSASLIAGWLASMGVGPGWTTSLFSRLTQVSIEGVVGPCPQWPVLLQEISSLAAEAYFGVLRQEATERQARLLSEHTPIIRLTEALPALIVVADPSSEVWEDLLDRLLTEAVRTGASSMVVDLTYSSVPRKRILASLRRFSQHKHARTRNILVIGVNPTDLPPGSNLTAIASFDQALSHAAVVSST